MPDTTPLPTPCNRRDPWQERPEHSIEYRLRTEADADVLCRLLGLFAQLQLLPQHLQAHQQDGDLHVQLRLPGLSLHRAGVLANKLRGLVCVWQVDWRRLDHSLAPGAARTG
ncbi:hypothetical protein [Pseudomonas sp. LPB0260]|uniref:hypothetical protein n=1 Tax=Pseudomonas sp. LPB0260 TaxID=2614442 RepID=UPI0021158D02|nr:hypothetical protein [Pseudomonas sp. LPB0260]